MGFPVNIKPDDDDLCHLTFHKWGWTSDKTELHIQAHIQQWISKWRPQPMQQEWWMQWMQGQIASSMAASQASQNSNPVNPQLTTV